MVFRSHGKILLDSSLEVWHTDWEPGGSLRFPAVPGLKAKHTTDATAGISSQFWRPEPPRSSASLLGSPVRALFLAFRQLPSFHLYRVERERGSVQCGFLFLFTTSGWKLPPMTSSKLNHLPKASPLNTATWGSGLQLMNLRRTLFTRSTNFTKGDL